MTGTAPAVGLGIDAGGSRTRWALVTDRGDVLAEGDVAGLSALQLASAAGQAAWQAGLQQLSTAALQVARPGAVRAGLSGFGGDGVQLTHWLSHALGLPPAAVTLSNDMEIAYLDSFTPGQGYLVYAGTGSIGAWIDANGVFHRAGGRGVLLDDGGGGYWIAREALRQIWRAEDEAPGSWRSSAMAAAVFAHIGSSEWAATRAFVYEQERGAIGKLALAVALAAERDAAAMAILQAAGVELARLALALVRRYGKRPLVLTGRAAQLHPAIAGAMRNALPVTIQLTQKVAQPHIAAARLAARNSLMI